MTAFTKWGPVLAFAGFGLLSFGANAAVPCSTEIECNKHFMALLPSGGSYTTVGGHETPGPTKGKIKRVHYRALFGDQSTTSARKAEGYTGRPDLYVVLYDKNGDTASIVSIEHQRITRSGYKPIDGDTLYAEQVAQRENATRVARSKIPPGGGGTEIAKALPQVPGVPGDTQVAKIRTPADCEKMPKGIKQLKCQAEVGMEGIKNSDVAKGSNGQPSFGGILPKLFR